MSGWDLKLPRLKPRQGLSAITFFSEIVYFCITPKRFAKKLISHLINAPNALLTELSASDLNEKMHII